MNIIDEIMDERRRQITQRGNVLDDLHTANDWATFIIRYVAKATPELKHSEDGELLETPESIFRTNMIKIAALSMAAIAAVDRNDGLPLRHYDKEVG